MRHRLGPYQYCRQCRQGTGAVSRLQWGDWLEFTLKKLKEPNRVLSETYPPYRGSWLYRRTNRTFPAVDFTGYVLHGGPML